MKITASIIAFNEEAKIAAAIESVAWADEILLVDSESTDRTVAVAEAHGARAVTQPWLGFARQKQAALDAAQNDWVFSLDADERVSAELRDEILRLKNLPAGELAGGYRVARLSFYMNRPIRHGGWYPDWQLRFFDRRRGRWGDALVHESVEMLPGAEVEKLSGDILHYSVEDAAHHHRMIGERYAPLAARQMLARGRRTSPARVAAAGGAAFARSYFLKAGFLDGFPGFCIARFAAHHAFLKHLILWEMQNDRARAGRGA